MTTVKIVAALSWALVILYALRTVGQMGFATATGQWWFVPMGVLLIGILWWSTRRSLASQAFSHAAPVAAIEDWPYPPCWQCGAEVTSAPRCPKCKADQHVVRLFCEATKMSADLTRLFPSFRSCVRCLTYAAPRREFWFFAREPQVRRGREDVVVTAPCCDGCWRQHARTTRLWAVLHPVAEVVIGLSVLAGVVLAGVGIVGLFEDATLGQAATLVIGGAAAVAFGVFVYERWELHMGRGLAFRAFGAGRRRNGRYAFHLRFERRATAERLRHMQKPSDLEVPDVETSANRKVAAMSRQWVLDEHAALLRNKVSGQTIELRHCRRVNTMPSGYEVSGPYKVAWINDLEIEVVR